MAAKNKFYGWRVLAGCMLCMFLVQGFLQAFGVFMPKIVEGSEWSLSQVAKFSTFASTGGFLANLLLGRALKKIRVKTALVVGSAFLPVYALLTSLSQSVWAFWLSGLLAGMAIGWGTIAPCSIIITRWFKRYRTLCVAGVTACSMLGSVLINPLIALIIEAYDWRRAYQFGGVGLGLLALLAVLLLIKEEPQALGQQPYGAEEEAELHVPEEGVSPREARGSLSYWLLLPGIFLLGFSTNVENYMPAFWQYRGLSSVNASLILSCYALIAAIISLCLSRVNDRLGGRRYVLITSLLFIASLLIMTLTDICSSLPLLVLCCVPFAAGAKKAVTMTPALVVEERFGRLHYSKIIGPFAAMLQLGIAASNLVIGPLAEISYELAFLTMTAVNLAGMALVFFALRKTGGNYSMGRC